MSDWQPIQTAPRSIEGRNYGPEILLTDGENIFIGFWNSRTRTWDDGDFRDDLGFMSHWQELPELPQPHPSEAVQQ